MEKAKDFYSKNVADAIRQACAEFGTSQEKLDIEVVETGSAGIFGLCRKRAHIRVSPKKGTKKSGKAPAKKAPSEASGTVKKDAENVQDTSAESKPASEPKRSGRPSGKGKQKTGREEPSDAAAKDSIPVAPPDEEVLASIHSYLDQVLNLMGMPSQIKVVFNGSGVDCQVDGDHVGEIAGPEGRTLDSMQYLLRKVFSRELPDRMMIDLNAGDFRERRMDELQKKAVELAEKVKSDGKTQAIPALNPSERRAVHVTLQDDKTVRSRSVGDGLFKKVLIYKPGSKAKKSGGRRRGRPSGRAADK